MRLDRIAKGQPLFVLYRRAQAFVGYPPRAIKVDYSEACEYIIERGLDRVARSREIAKFVYPPLGVMTVWRKDELKRHWHLPVEELSMMFGISKAEVHRVLGPQVRIAELETEATGLLNKIRPDQERLIDIEHEVNNLELQDED